MTDKICPNYLSSTLRCKVNNMYCIFNDNQENYNYCSVYEQFLKDAKIISQSNVIGKLIDENKNIQNKIKSESELYDVAINILENRINYLEDQLSKLLEK